MQIHQNKLERELHWRRYASLYIEAIREELSRNPADEQLRGLLNAIEQRERSAIASSEVTS